MVNICDNIFHMHVKTCSCLYIKQDDYGRNSYYGAKKISQKRFTEQQLSPFPIALSQWRFSVFSSIFYHSGLDFGFMRSCNSNLEALCNNTFAFFKWKMEICANICTVILVATKHKMDNKSKKKCKNNCLPIYFLIISLCFFEDKTLVQKKKTKTSKWIKLLWSEPGVIFSVGSCPVKTSVPSVRN